MDYEPWWMGTNAEVYFVFYEYNYFDDLLIFADQNPTSNVSREAWDLALGDRTNYVDYRVWKWDIYHYVQTKPWRSINLNTGWKATDFNFNLSYKLRVIEYDPLFYDRGASFWCSLYQITIANSLLGMDLIGAIVGFIGYLACSELIINDDAIGDKLQFEDIVESAKNHLGTVYEWNAPGAWKIRLKAQ